MEDNEQWKTDGNCKFCRRKKYCGAECTASKRRIKAEIYSLIAEKTGLRPVFEMINNLNYGG